MATFGSNFRALFSATASSLVRGADYVRKNWRQIAAGALNRASDALMSFHRDPFAALAGGINGVLETTVYPLLDAVWFAEEGIFNKLRTGQWKAEWGSLRRFASDRVASALTSVGLRDVRQAAAFRNGSTVGQIIGIIGDLIQLPKAVHELGSLITRLPQMTRSGLRWAGNTAREVWQAGRRIATQFGDDIAETWGAFSNYLDDASRRVYDSMFGNGRQLATEGAEFEGRVARFADEGGGGEGANTNGMSVPRTDFPHGFADKNEFVAFGRQIYKGLEDAGYPDVDVAFAGSSVSGYKYTTGSPFDVDRISDFDIALAGENLLASAKSAGAYVIGSGTRTVPLKNKILSSLGLRELKDALIKMASRQRQVNFMVYKDIATLAERGEPFILISR